MANSGNLMFDSSGILDIGLNMNTYFKKMLDDCDDMKKRFEHVTESANWDGDAVDYFLEMYSSFKVNVSELEDRINTINNYLDTVINNYMYIEQNGWTGEYVQDHFKELVDSGIYDVGEMLDNGETDTVTLMCNGLDADYLIENDLATYDDIYNDMKEYFPSESEAFWYSVSMGVPLSYFVDNNTATLEALAYNYNLTADDMRQYGATEEQIAAAGL